LGRPVSLSNHDSHLLYSTAEEEKRGNKSGNKRRCNLDKREEKRKKKAETGEKYVPQAFVPKEGYEQVKEAMERTKEAKRPR
jgi:hypothetical protein